MSDPGYISEPLDAHQHGMMNERTGQLLGSLAGEVTEQGGVDMTSDILIADLGAGAGPSWSEIRCGVDDQPFGGTVDVGTADGSESVALIASGVIAVPLVLD
jgi:hypothetical protein